MQLQERGRELCLRVLNRRSHIALDDITISVAVHTDYDSVIDVSSMTGSVTLADKHIIPQSEAFINLIDLLPQLYIPNSNVVVGNTDVTSKGHLISEVFLLVTISSQNYKKECMIVSTSSLSHSLLTQAFHSYVRQSSSIRKSTSYSVVTKSVTSKSAHPVKYTHATDFSKDVYIRWHDESYAVVSGVTGQITKWVIISQHREINMLTSPVDLCLWRAITDNDRGGGPLSHESRWKQAGYKNISLTKFSSCKVTATSNNANGSVVVKVQWQLLIDSTLFLPYFAKVVPCEATYTFSSDKMVNMKIQIELPSYFPTVPRFGIRFSMPSSYSRVTWFGFGPHECYIDRQESAYVGRFTDTVLNLHVPYVYPQENGSRLDPRYVCMNNSTTDSSLLILPIHNKSDPSTNTFKLPSWSASTYSLEMLDSCLHEHELPTLVDGNTYVHIDAAMTGVGGYDSWSPNIKEEYLLYPSQCSVLEVRFCPLSFVNSAGAGAGRASESNNEGLLREQIIEDTYHRYRV